MFMRWLLLSLLLIPAVEIGVFIWVGKVTGPWWIIFLIVLTGILGIAIARKQGMNTWKRAQMQMSKGYPPTEEIMDGICLLIGAVLLLIPGFVTDIIGFVLLLPATRKPLKLLIRKIMNKFAGKQTIIYRKW